MAIRKVGEGVSSWNNKTEFPKDRYAICCIEESLETSKDTNNPMVKRTWEIISPETNTIGDRTVSTAGLKIPTYTVVKVHAEDGESWDQEKSDKAFGRFCDDLRKAGFEGDEIDDENPPLFMKGKTLDAIVYGKKDVARKNPTPEELRKGIRAGAPIKDADGKDVITYQLQIESLLGLAATQVDVAY